LEKIVRKDYENPFNEITDFAGVRLVFLYNSDFEKIEKVIEENFKIKEKVDKLNDKGVDKFGYGAIHYIVQLSKKHSGARYDNLKNLNCEIQVRTVLQDAWSIIDHHLVYKNESSIPKQLRRKLNSLAGLFDTADDQFNQLRIERESYIEKVEKSISSPRQFLNEDLNIDSFRQYIAWKFPQLPIETFDGQYEIVYSGIKDISELNKLSDLDRLVEKGMTKFIEIKPKFKDEPNFHSSSVAALIAVSLVDNRFDETMLIPKGWLERIRETTPNNV
jgi:ppGpp synthetase/RelA/SpoT-type nucleotidyltranferase